MYYYYCCPRLKVIVNQDRYLFYRLHLIKYVYYCSILKNDLGICITCLAVDSLKVI